MSSGHRKSATTRTAGGLDFTAGGGIRSGVKPAVRKTQLNIQAPGTLL